MATFAVVASLLALALCPAQALKVAPVAPKAPANITLVCRAPGDDHDKWYKTQKAKIDEDCENMRKKLDDEFENKLQDGVDGAKGNADAKHAAEGGAKRTLAEEKEHLAAEKAHEAKANKKLCDMEGDAQACKDTVEHLKQKREALRKLVDEKKKCIEELRQAEHELQEQEEKLCVAQAKAEKEKGLLLKGKKYVDREHGHVEYEKGHVDEANLRLQKANDEVKVAEDELAKIKAKRDAAKVKVTGGSDKSDSAGLVVEIGWGNVTQVHNNTKSMPM